MPTDSTKPIWIEPPPQKSGGMGCFGKGCLALVVICLIVAGSVFLIFRSFTMAKPVALPVEELSPQALADVQQRIDNFEATPPLATSTPMPTATPAASVAPEETPAPTAPPTPPPGRELRMSAAEINGLIAANPKSRGHAYVSLSGNTADVQISVSPGKVPGFPKGYLNGTFKITTDGPTPLSALRVSKIQANGFPMPSGILSMSYRGKSILGIAMDAAAPYNVSTAEIRDGVVVLH